MSRSALSVFVFGIYAIVVGIVGLAAPNFLLEKLSGASTTEVWIRLVGLLLIYLGLIRK